MNKFYKKHIKTFIPAIGFLIWALFIMIKSFGTGETWRIVLSTTGFLLFFGLIVFVTIRWIQIYKEDNNKNINKGC